MKKRKAQISVEYILIITAALMILIPGIYVFRSYAADSNDRIVDRRLGDISSEIITKARKMHYYGPPSRSIVNFEMPPGVDSMFILALPDGESYLGFGTVSGGNKKSFLYQSPVLLHALYPECIVSPAQECDIGTNMCYCFPERFYTSGIKSISVTAQQLGCPGGRLCVFVDEAD